MSTHLRIDTTSLSHPAFEKPSFTAEPTHGVKRKRTPDEIVVNILTSTEALNPMHPTAPLSGRITPLSPLTPALKPPGTFPSRAPSPLKLSPKTFEETVEDLTVLEDVTMDKGEAADAIVIDDPEKHLSMAADVDDSFFRAWSLKAPSLDKPPFADDATLADVDPIDDDVIIPLKASLDYSGITPQELADFIIPPATRTTVPKRKLSAYKEILRKARISTAPEKKAERPAKRRRRGGAGLGIVDTARPIYREVILPTDSLAKNSLFKRRELTLVKSIQRTLRRTTPWTEADISTLMELIQFRDFLGQAYNQTTIANKINKNQPLVSKKLKELRKGERYSAIISAYLAAPRLSSTITI
jgi:hypothetical protein